MSCHIEKIIEELDCYFAREDLQGALNYTLRAPVIRKLHVME